MKNVVSTTFLLEAFEVEVVLVLMTHFVRLDHILKVSIQISKLSLEIWETLWLID
jgi:hypothetical protein